MTISAYLPVAIMFLLALVFAAGSVMASRLLAPSDPTPEKLEPYECGIVPLQDPVQRFPVRFYMVAMLFVLFDIEIVFPLRLGGPLRATRAGLGCGAIGIFTLLLIETLVYVWKRGALDWNVARRTRHRRVVGASTGRGARLMAQASSAAQPGNPPRSTKPSTGRAPARCGRRYSAWPAVRSR